MKTIHIIYDLISEKVYSVSHDEEMLVEGIKQYVKENHLEDWEETVEDDKILTEVLSGYLRPVLQMSPEALADYFEYYAVIQKFSVLTNAILDMAEAAYYEKPVEEDAEEKEKALVDLSLQLHKSRTLKEVTKIHVSEALLNLDYVRGNRSKLSMSLAKRVNCDSVY